MSAPRRQVLQKIRLQKHTHAGLWFDKYLQEQKGSTLEPFAKHIRQTGEIEEPPEYNSIFTRWRYELKKLGAYMREARVVGRVAAGLGGESVIENGMTLHHTYGVPIIPGSSLKGTARAYAVANLEDPWGKGGSAFRTLFGGQLIHSGERPEDKARIGMVLFYDALPVPGTFSIHNEVMTVHHPDYYQDKKDAAPADWDSPTPIPFPAIHGRFLIALYAPDAPLWAVTGMNILQIALTEAGVGGKTSSGYGRFDLTELPLAPEEQAVQNFSKDLDALSDTRVAGQLNNFINRWRNVELEDQYKQQMAQAILDRVEAAGRTIKSKDKPWYQELVRFIEGNAK